MLFFNDPGISCVGKPARDKNGSQVLGTEWLHLGEYIIEIPFNIIQGDLRIDHDFGYQHTGIDRIGNYFLKLIAECINLVKLECHTRGGEMSAISDEMFPAGM